MGLQPGPVHAALFTQILLQAAGWEREQQDSLPRPQLQVSAGVKSSESSIMYLFLTFLLFYNSTSKCLTNSTWFHHFVTFNMTKTNLISTKRKIWHTSFGSIFFLSIIFTTVTRCTHLQWKFHEPRVFMLVDIRVHLSLYYVFCRWIYTKQVRPYYLIHVCVDLCYIKWTFIWFSCFSFYYLPHLLFSDQICKIQHGERSGGANSLQSVWDQVRRHGVRAGGSSFVPVSVQC